MFLAIVFVVKENKFSKFDFLNICVRNWCSQSSHEVNLHYI